jgi:hypothetical protein
MGNTTENQEGGEAQQDEIPRDTQFNNQNIESPSAHENTQSQQNQSPKSPELNQVNQVTQSNQYVVMQGGEQYINNQNNMQYQTQQGSQVVQPGQGRVEYQISQVNQEYADNQGKINQGNQALEGQVYTANQLYAEAQGNQEYEGQEVVDGEEYREGEEYVEGEEEEVIEVEEVVEGEGEGEVIEGEEYAEGEEIQDNEQIQEGEGQISQRVDGYQIGQKDNKLINQQNRSYKITQDGKTYQVNERSQQYEMNSGDGRYKVKQEYKETEKTSENIPDYPNNNYLQGEKILSQEKKSIRKNIKILPKDSLPKVYIQSSGYYDNPTQGRYTQYYNDIPRYMSFQRSNIKSPSKIRSSVNVVKTENVSELIEIPRSEYESYAGRETIFIGGGMDTGEYKFRGQGIVITQAKDPGKIIISEEEILKEINRRKNKPKKDKKKRYEVLDRFYAITEFDGKPIRKIEKVEQQQKQYEYEEQQKYYSNSKGNLEYQFSSKESQSQMQSNNNQSQQFQFQQSQFQSQGQSQGQMNLQLSGQGQNQGQIQSSQMQQMSMNYSQNQNNQNEDMMNSNNMKIKYKNMSLSSPSDNYSKYLFEQINKIRADPQSYIGIIEDAKNNIIKDKRGRYIYNGKIKIALTNGEIAFNNAINYLKTVKSMNKLEFNPYLTVELPKTENEIKYKNDLRLKVDNMVNNGIPIKSYWRDVIKDPQISFLMMIVDDSGDNSGMKRKDILDPNMKYIGISSIDINGTFVCYLTLSYE